MRSAKSKRACKRRPVQQELFRRGGKRRGAGRKPKGARAGERHVARPVFKPYHALHVVMRIAPAVGSLRRRKMYKAMRAATITASLRERFRIIHMSLQRTHVHMLVEAEHKVALSRGMQSFQISAARNINTALGNGTSRRLGTVFSDRYHVEVITSPTQARNAIAYILCNFRKHREDQVAPMSSWRIDWFSSAMKFPDWAERGEETLLRCQPEAYEPLVVHEPKTWLLKDGWKKAGPISCREVPSAKR
jgi:REP element-mobilizing transposase RayT